MRLDQRPGFSHRVPMDNNDYWIERFDGEQLFHVNIIRQNSGDEDALANLIINLACIQDEESGDRLQFADYNARLKPTGYELEENGSVKPIKGPRGRPRLLSTLVCKRRMKIKIIGRSKAALEALLGWLLTVQPNMPTGFSGSSPNENLKTCKTRMKEKIKHIG